MCAIPSRSRPLRRSGAWENVLLTPHVSGRGFGHDRGTERLIWEIVMDNLARYLEGKKLRHIVDMNRGY